MCSIVHTPRVMGATVKARLDGKAASTGADEVFVMAVGPDLESRIRSLELIKSA